MKCNLKRFNTDCSITPHSGFLLSWTLNTAVTATQAAAYTTGTEMLTHIITLTSYCTYKKIIQTKMESGAVSFVNLTQKPMLCMLCAYMQESSNQGIK